MFFIKVSDSLTRTSPGLSSIYFSETAGNNSIILVFKGNAKFVFGCKNPKDTYEMVVATLADMEARTIGMTVNAAPSPSGMWSSISYNRLQGDDLVVDMKALIAEIEDEDEGDEK